MSPLQLNNVDDFNSFINNKSISLSAVHFFAAWAPSCDQLNTVLSDLEEEFKVSNVKTAFIDAEAVADISLKYGITAAPTVLLFKGGEKVDTINGFNLADLKLKLSQHASGSAPAAAVAVNNESLNDRLKRLVNTDKLMLFMKGNAEQPRCGFSRQCVQLLNDINAKFSTFDILSDEEVRQGLKEYSNWPTYPQLYLDGELIGGLDVIREELQDKDFVDGLPKKV